MTAIRGRPKGQPKTGGRRRGSIDREQRKLLTDQMAGDLLATYKALGGRRWLLQFAKDQPGEFLRQGLSRLFPQPVKDDLDADGLNISINAISDQEAAVRIAFVLSKGMQEPEPVAVQRVTPAEPIQQPEPEPEAPLPPYDPQREQWAASLSQSPEEQLVAETYQESLETYAGGAREQGLAARKRSLL
ncbi:MAG: hypothetical protein ACI9UK_000677 [Candidatus Krumholzibacteriia bacterium]|jgi:hypothetical protein